MVTCSMWNLSVPQSNSLKLLAASLFQSVYHRFDYGSLGRGPGSRPGWRGAAFDGTTRSSSTKDPLCQHWGSGGGHGAAGNSHPNRQHQNGHSSFQHRYTEQVHCLFAQEPSELPPVLPPEENVIKIQKKKKSSPHHL